MFHFLRIAWRSLRMMLFDVPADAHFIRIRQLSMISSFLRKEKMMDM